MSEGNGHSNSKGLPYSVNIPKDDQIPSPNEMIQDMWVEMKLVKAKVYGDRERKITGITDELENLNKTVETKITTLNDTLSPLVKDYERRKLIRRWVVIPLTFIGGAVGTWAKNYIETHYLK